jgi:hypothetical protein
MRAQQFWWKDDQGWQARGGAADLVLYFGSRDLLADGTRTAKLASLYPKAHMLGCSTGGQIFGGDVTDDGIAAVALSFDETRVRVESEPLGSADNSEDRGKRLGQRLAAPDLAGIFVLSDGLDVNGSKLVSGLIAGAGANVPVTGGLAGDGSRFEETLVGADGPPMRGIVAAVGFYGGKINIGHGSAGGWDAFGPKRRITRSRNNVLLELDDAPALDLYERYLGEEESAALPGSALLFPLQIYDPAHPKTAVVRTVLGVNRKARSMTFAGDMPSGWVAQLMHSNFDRLSAGSADAARQAREGAGKDGIAILVSCIGRKLVMGQRASDEVEAAGAELGAGVGRIGFYSYGEISPHAESGMCELHNQTMTVTTVSESA